MSPKPKASSHGAAPARPAARPLTHPRVLPIVIGIMLAMFLGALDQTIVATALPTIGRHFGDLGDLSWVVTAYLLTGTAVTPLYGKLSDIHGRRAMMLIAIALFIARLARLRAGAEHDRAGLRARAAGAGRRRADGAVADHHRRHRRRRASAAATRAISRRCSRSPRWAGRCWADS